MFSRSFIMAQVTKLLLLNPLCGPSISSTAFNFYRSISSNKFSDVIKSTKTEKLTEKATDIPAPTKKSKTLKPYSDVVETVGVAKHVAVIKNSKKKVITKAQMRYMENKAIFGDLLETKVEKDRQIKKEIKLAKKLTKSATKTQKVPLDLLHDESLEIVDTQPPKIFHDESSMTNENISPISIDKASSFLPFSKSTKILVKGASDKPLTGTPEDYISKKSFSHTTNSYQSGENEFETRISEESRFVTDYELKIVQSFDKISPMSLPSPAKRGIENRLPSVTKILSATMPPEQKELLEKWEKKMIKELGLEGFQKFKKDMLANGRELHSNIHDLLIGTPEDNLTIREPNEGHWRSMKSVFKEITQVRVLESHVTHPKLDYCGIIDCVAHYRNDLVLIDWKTSKKPKPTVSMTYDTPLQIAAYIGAINEDPYYKTMKINRGLIVIAYESGQMCETFVLTPSDVDIYWNRWKDRLDLFKKQFK